MSNGGRRRDDDERIDRAIDGAVREMLDVEPLPGLRGRVLRTIEGDSPVAADVASAFRRKIFIFGVPLAAAAILILAVLLPRGRETESPRAPVTTAVNTQPQNPIVTPSPTPVAPGPGATPAIEPRPAVVARRAPRPAPATTSRPDRVVAAASFEPAEPAGPEIAPLKSIEPIRVAPVAHDTIAPDAITVRALNPMNELQIAPLTPPGGRN